MEAILIIQLYFIFAIVSASSASPSSYIQASHGDLHISKVEPNGDVIQYTRLNGVFNIYIPQPSSVKKINNIFTNQTSMLAKTSDSGSKVVDRCLVIDIQQTFIVNNCARSIKLSTCTGSCSQDRYCRTSSTVSAKLEFKNCPTTQPDTFLMLKNAKACKCTYEKLAFPGI